MMKDETQCDQMRTSDSESDKETEEASANSINEPTGDSAYNHRVKKAIIVVIALSIVIVVASIAFNSARQRETEQAGAINKNTSQTVHISVDASGWEKGDDSFNYAVVDESGEIVSKGELSPAKDSHAKLSPGMYAVSLTTIPTASDGKTTWAVPQSVQVQVLNKNVDAKFELTSIDLTDDDALSSLLGALPEAQRDATQKIVEEKKQDPKAGKIDTKPPAPVGPSHGDSGRSDGGNKTPDKKWGVVKAAWDETVTVRGAWDERVQVKAAWDERVVDRPAWTETVHHPAEYRTERIKVGVYFRSKDGKTFDNENDAAMYYYNTGIPYSVLPKYEDRQVLVRDAWDERVDHAATWRSVHHDAEYRTVHHPAETRVVHHPDEYGWIDS